MLRIISFQSVARWVAIATAVISTAVYAAVQQWLDDTYPLFKIVAFAVTVSTLLVFVLTRPLTLRCILKIQSTFDKNAFPDLSGTWDGEINHRSGVMPIKAVIRQTIDSMQIDVHGPTMKSSTLEATPVVERGQKKLYYVYHCLPQNPEHHAYHGSTIFDVRQLTEDGAAQLALSGRYFTDRSTVGTIQLKQISRDSSADVSYY